MKYQRDRIYAVLVLAPSLVLLAIFVYGFIAHTFITSTTDWGQGAALALEPELNFVGMQNYKALFTGFLDARFRQDLVNMLFFTVLFVGGSLVLGLSLAILLDQGIRGEGFFRTVFLFPMSLSFIVTGTVWRWVLQPRGGVNVLPTLIGLPPAAFLWTTSRQQILRFDWQKLPWYLALAGVVIFGLVAYHYWRIRRRRAAAIAGIPAAALLAWILSGAAYRLNAVLLPEPHGLNLALVGIVLAAMWQMSGYTMALFLAGLRGIPDELREAAKVDGCNRLQVYRFVELPLLKPVMLSAVIVLGHIALKAFDLIFAMAGPDNGATSVPAVLMYLTTFRGNQLAKGAAIATILLLMVSALIIPYMASTLRQRGAER